MKEIKNCEVCGNRDLVKVLDIGEHPMCDDLISISDNRVCKEYPIQIVLCENCNTAHQLFQINKNELFPATYHYRSRFTSDVLNGMSELTDSYIKRFGNCQGMKVLDIGCNDGSLLSIFKNLGAKTYGVEPTDAYKDAQDYSIYKCVCTY